MPEKVKVFVVAALGDRTLVQAVIEGLPHRFVLPRLLGSNKPGYQEELDIEELEGLPEAGISFSNMEVPTISPEDVALALHSHGIWEEADLAANPSGFSQALNDLSKPLMLAIRRHIVQ